MIRYSQLSLTVARRAALSGRAIACVTLLLAVAQTTAAAQLGLISRDSIVLKIDVLNATLVVDEADDAAPGLHMKFDPQKERRLRFDVLWPGEGDRSSVELITRSLPSSFGTARFGLRAEIELPGGKLVKTAERPFAAREFSAALFELYRLGDRALTLGISGEVVTELVVPTPSSVGAEVLFNVEVLTVQEGISLSVETNRLHTFVGESVSYGFQLGAAGVADAVRLTLKPVRLSGQVLEVEVTLSGTLPGSKTIELISRTEQWITSQGATSTIPFESGDPPTGYRFLVRPQF
jgi:hypothetical protein